MQEGGGAWKAKKMMLMRKKKGLKGEEEKVKTEEYRVLRREYLLLEEESVSLDGELDESQAEATLLEQQKKALLDQLVVLEGLVRQPPQPPQPPA